MKEQEISLTCYAIVSTNFALFLNPKFRGPNFTWEEFPLMMAEMCHNSIFMYSPKVGEKHMKLAYDNGKTIAEKLIRLMTEE